MGMTTKYFLGLAGACSFLCASSAANPALYQYGTNHANNQAMYNAYLAGKASNDSDSKLYKYMAMMQMMQANATALAGMSSRQKSEAKAPPSPTPIPQLELAKLEIPKQAEEKLLVDLSPAALSAKKAYQPLAAPPIPNVSPEAALQIVSNFKPAAKALPAAPAKEPVAPAAKAEASKLPPAIAEASLGQKLGYDNTAGGGREIASLGSANFVGTPGAATNAVPVVTSENITAPSQTAGRRASPEPPESSGSSDNGDERSGRGRGDDGFSEMLGNMMGLRIPTASAEDELFVPQKQEDPGSNIFEYASYRYKHTEIRKAKPKKKG